MRRWLPSLLLLLAGCAGVPTYTSQDLAILPCETDVPRFFQPYEFNVDGAPLFADQQAAVERRLRTQQPRDIIVFIHGWNKTAYVAEREYQDFLCRFHARLREAEQAAAVEPDRLLIIGIFWRSTLSANGPDPLLAKWITYFPIRERADLMARTGFTDMMRDLTNVLGERRPDKAKPKLHLVGHSFGGRMIVNGMRSFIHLGTPAHDLLRRVDRLNMVLLNAAIGPEDFKPIEAVALREPSGQQERGELLSAVQAQSGKVSAATTAKIYAGYTFNVYSGHDVANRWLFPLASLLTDDEARCGIGACGVDEYDTINVTPTGHLAEPPNPVGLAPGQAAVWNINADQVIFDHSDIYKGRVATLLFELTLKR
jgi:pimeloyl-ACP methyl ester carboxylesterase